MAEGSAPAASVRDVVKRVRDGAARRTVLDGVSFEIARGELVVVRGPSGSGKTTLLAIVGAMLSPTSGEVFLDGEATSRLREVGGEDVAGRSASCSRTSSSSTGSRPSRTCSSPAYPTGVRREDETRALTLLERFGLGSVARGKARALSGGERQRVALARALLADPPLLVLDEPTARLDDARATAIADELAGLARDGRAVLVATHDPRVVQSPAVTRVLDLVAGRLVPQA